MKGKIFASSDNIYQDQAKILFDYYRQAAEKIVKDVSQSLVCDCFPFFVQSVATANDALHTSQEVAGIVNLPQSGQHCRNQGQDLDIFF